MFVNRLILQQFRNYEELDLTFEKEINMIYGNNGQGKTNIIEAIYLFAAARSHRTNKERDMIRYDQPSSKMDLFFETKDRDFQAEFRLFQEKKHQISINDIPAAKNSDLIGNFNAVLFSPEDFGIIKDGPSERRRFTDIAISQVKPNYFKCLMQYQKIIKEKNKMLKEGSDFLALLDVYNESLATVAADILFYRNKFFEYLKGIMPALHREITLTSDEFRIEYDSCVPIDDRKVMKEEILKKLERSKQKELEERVSMVGPHREDVSFFIKGKKVREFASQGQQRTVILILKLAQAEFIKENNGEYPVLLLDDILSELDSTRRKFLMDEIKNKQVIITGTDKASFGRRKDTKLIHIEDGMVID